MIAHSPYAHTYILTQIYLRSVINRLRSSYF